MEPFRDAPGSSEGGRYVGRAGEKLEFGLAALKISVAGKVAADLGAAVGGFTHCLLEHGARRVYSVDTCYGTLDWSLRNDERVVVMERTNAMHVRLPEPVDVVTVDVGWTRQRRILRAALALLRPGGLVLSLMKPQYEAETHELDKGRVREEYVESVRARVLQDLSDDGITPEHCLALPEVRGKNREYMLLIAYQNQADDASSV